METSLNQRIKFVAEKKQLSQNALAKKIGFPQTTINHLYTRGTDPSGKMLEKIVIAFPEINAFWLLTGQGEPFLFNAGSAGKEEKNSLQMVGNEVVKNSVVKKSYKHRLRIINSQNNKNGVIALNFNNSAHGNSRTTFI